MPPESRPSQVFIDFFHEQLSHRYRERSDLDPVPMPLDAPEVPVCMVALPVDGLYAGRVLDDAPSWWRFPAIRGSLCAFADIGRAASGEPEWRGLMFGAELRAEMVDVFRWIAAHRPATDIARIVTVPALGIAALWFAAALDSDGASPTDRFLPIQGMPDLSAEDPMPADAFWALLRDRAHGPDAQGGGLAPEAAEPVPAGD